MVHIPYNGGPAASLAVSKGEVHLLFAALSNVQPLLKTGKVKLLAVSNAKRSAKVKSVCAVKLCFGVLGKGLPTPASVAAVAFLPALSSVESI